MFSRVMVNVLAHLNWAEPTKLDLDISASVDPAGLSEGKLERSAGNEADREGCSGTFHMKFWLADILVAQGRRQRSGAVPCLDRELRHAELKGPWRSSARLGSLLDLDTPTGSAPHIQQPHEGLSLVTRAYQFEREPARRTRMFLTRMVCAPGWVADFRA